MKDFPMQYITIYHKNEKTWDRYVKKASYRNVSTLNHNKTGQTSVDSATIRIFDINDYNTSWFVEKGDVIVNQKVNDKIEDNSPITQLSKKYGKSKVHKVNMVDKFIFEGEDKEMEELNHIKIGCI